jgi:hypothetical protein
VTNSHVVSEQELEQRLLAACNRLRGPVDPTDYKAFIFPLLFLKRISDYWDWEYARALDAFEADEYEARARALRQIVAGVRALNGHAGDITAPRFVEQNGTIFVASQLDADGPRGREAVRRVLAERPDHVWKVIEIKRELLGRGWAPTPKAVEASLKRMRELDEVVCPKYGYYRLAGHQPGTRTAEPTGVQGKDDEAR